jgi:hypothetical protein
MKTNPDGRAMTRKFGGLIFTRQWTEYDFSADVKEAAERMRKNGYLVRVVKNKGHKDGPKYHRYTLYARKA